MGRRGYSCLHRGAGQVVNRTGWSAQRRPPLSAFRTDGLLRWEHWSFSGVSGLKSSRLSIFWPPPHARSDMFTRIVVGRPCLRCWGWHSHVQVIFPLLTRAPFKQHKRVMFGHRYLAFWDWCRAVRVLFSPLPHALSKQHKKVGVWLLLSDSSGLMSCPSSSIFTIPSESCPLPTAHCDPSGLWPLCFVF